ncbi:hypothetical protein GN956_G1819 [Arapaima gigas]
MATSQTSHAFLSLSILWRPSHIHLSSPPIKRPSPRPPVTQPTAGHAAGSYRKNPRSFPCTRPDSGGETRDDGGSEQKHNTSVERE